MRKILPSHFRRRKGAEEITSDASSAATSSAPNKSFPSGIKPLYTPDDAVVDIVFIHGLTGDRERTWTAHDADEPWPKTLLPSQLPKARTLTYGYDAYVTNWTGVVAQSRVHNHAWGLLTSLATYREQDDSNERPIIFVCHSLGGLVCKDALTLSSQKSEDRFRRILRLTLGIAFLGTPHQGAGLAIWAEMISKALGIIKKTNTKIVAVLKQDSEVLARIQDGFHTIVHERSKQGKPIEITCFFEELPLPGIGPVVPQASAVLPGYPQIGIHSNHMDIARFSSSDDTGFQAICGELRAWIKGIATSTVVQRGNDAAVESKQIPTDVPCNRNPDFVGRTEILEQLRQQLGHEQNQTRGKWHLRAAIHGLGGIGKTQVALEYVYRLQEALPAMSIFWVHASNAERFQQSYAEIAKRCQIPGYDDPEANLLQLVKEWLSRKECGHWFMVVDNADDTHLFFANRSAEREGKGEGEDEGEKSNRGENLGRYLPECCHGSILITTRNKEAGSRLRKGKYPTEIGRMDTEHATRLLQTKFEGANFDLNSLPSLILRLEGLPLALVQAAAYILEKSITVDEYLALLGECDQTLIDCLSEEFETDARDEETPRAVAETWILSFEQIRHRNILAADLLSLMSFFDRQAIPKEFLVFYSQQLKEEAVTEKQLTDALGLLRAFSFITQDTGHGFDMHRLIQLATKRWLLQKKAADIFTTKALLSVLVHFPEDVEATENWNLCTAYLPHALKVLDSEGDKSEEMLLSKATLLVRVAVFYYKEGYWPESLQCNEQAARLHQEILGLEHQSELQIMSNLALVYRNMANWGKAEQLDLQLVAIFKAKLGEDHPHTLRSIARLARTYSHQGRWAMAEELEVRVMENRKAKLGEYHHDTLRSMTCLAQTYRDQGRWNEAEKLEVQVLELSRAASGADHLDTVNSMANLAETYGRQGRWGEAEKLELQVLEIRKAKLGEHHPQTLTSISNLAMTYRDQGKWDEAEVMAQQVMKIRKARFGQDHPYMLYSMTELMGIYHSQGRLDEAEQLALQVVKGSRAEFGEDHYFTLRGMGILAAIYQEQGRWNKAQELAEQVQGIHKANHGEDHPFTLDNMLNLAAIYHSQGRFEEAEALELQGLEIRKVKFGEDHPDTLTNMANLACTWKSQGRLPEALELLRACVASRQRLLGPDHPDTRAVVAALADWSSQNAGSR